MNMIFYDDQKQCEQEFRSMWNTIFGDPDAYEEFYFSTIYPENKTIAYQKNQEIAGMIHLNPYTLSVNGKDCPLHYIVGVATLADCRRQGIMRKLLVRIMKDMAMQQEVFTYLMPAKKEYYEPFDFVFVQTFNAEETETSYKEGRSSLLKVVKKEEYQEVQTFINAFCNKHYCVYTKCDSDYLKRLYQESLCESGELLILRECGRIIGFCCYGQDDNEVYIRQIFTDQKDKMIEEIRRFFPGRKIEITSDGGKQGNGASIMARILRLDLLMPMMKATVEKRFVITIEDHFLEEQNGSFEFVLSENGCMVKRTKEEANNEITISDLSKIIFGFGQKALLEMYPEFKGLEPLTPFMIGEIV